MSANTLSPLSRGYGSWTAGYVDPYFGDKQHEHEHETLLPDIDHQSHVHGITVGSRSGRSTAMSYAPTRRSREPTSDGIPLPRTLTTRKGALQIYVAPDDLEDIEGVGLAGDGDGLELRPKYVQVRHPHGKELIDLSLKLGTMERLALSVLQFGDQEYDHEHTSVSDAKNKSFLKFLRSIDGEMPKKSSVDAHLRPGGDLNAYLRDLQSSASSRHPSDGSTYLPKSRESAELQALLRGLDTSGWPHTYGQDGSIGGHGGQFTRPVSRVSSRGGTSPGPPSTPRSSYQVLSAKKLVSSIKSGGYLGRPGSSFSANDDEINTGDSPQHVSSASVSHREWTPTDSTDNQLLDARHSFFCGLEEGDSDSDGKKRMGPREISFNSGLYPGRLARKGEGQGSGLEVKVTGKGESDTRSQGHRSSQMYQIEEEQNIDSVRNNTGEEESLVQDESPDVETEMFDTNSWADKVSPAQNRAGTAQSFVTSTITVPDEETRVIDVEIDEKPVSNNRRGSVKLSSRPSSCKSRPSSARIRPVSGRLRPRSGEARPNSEKSSSSSSSSWVNQSGSRRVSVISLQRFKPVEKPQEESRSNMAIKRGSISYDLGKERRKSLNERRRSSPEHAIQSQQMEVLKTLENVPTVEEMGETVDMDMDLRVTDETPYITDGVENGMSLERDEEKISVARSESRESGIEEMDDELIAEEDIINDIHECNKEIQKIEALADKAKEEVAVDEAPVYEHSDSESSMDEETVQEVLIINSEVRSKTEKGVKEEFVEESTDNINVCGSGIDVGADVGDGLGVGGGVGDDVVGMEDVDNKQMGLEQEYEGQSQGLSEGEGEEEVDEERLSEIRSYKSSKKGRSWKSVSGVEESEDYIDEESRNSSGSLVYKLPTLGSDLLAEQKDDSSDDLDRTMLETQAGFSGTSGSYSDLLASNLNSLSAHSSRHTSAGVSGPSSVGRSPFASRPVSANTSMDQENQYQSTLQPLSADVTPMFLSRPATAASSRKASQVSSRPESAKLSSPIPMTSIISRHDSNGSVDDINEYIANDADVVDQSVDNIEVRMIQETDSHSGMEHKEKDEHLDIDCVQETNNKIDVDETNEEAEQSNTHMGRDESATVLEDSSEQTVNNIQTSKKIADVPDSKVLISNIEKKQGATTTPSEMQTVSPAAKQLTTAAVRRPLVQKPNNVAQHKPALAHKNKTVQQSKVVKGMPSQKGRKESVGNHGAKPVAISGKSELRETTLHGESEEVTVHGKSNLGKEGVSKKGLGEGPKGAQGEVDTVEASLGDWEHDSKLLDDQLEDAHNIAAELDTLGLRKTAEKPKKGKKEGYTFPLATGRRPKAPQEKAKIPDHLADALSRRPGTSYSKLEEDLEKKGFLRDGKVTSLVGETLSGPTLEAVGEGLTEEELEMAKLILQQKLDEAKGMISGESKEKTGKAVVKKKAPSGKGGKKGGKKKGGADLEEKSSEELEREAIRAKHAEEKELRDEEAANLQRQIAEKRHMLETQSNLTAEKSKELQEKMAELERQAEDLMRAEDEARTILAEVRRKQREERDARRKADLERKRQEAQDRREREKREAEEKASREREMIEKMQDVEMRKLKREEEERRAAEEERLAQERYEAELAENARLEEEQEDRMKELERQAEEEAMMRLVEEREAAERERRRLREQEEALQEHERLKMEALAEEQYKLEAERRRLEDAEQAKRDTERQRLMELRNLEEEARLQMQEEIERRRTDAFTRRDFNLENRSHVDRLKHNQGLTRAWTFSYFVHWPRETYESSVRPKLDRKKMANRRSRSPKSRENKEPNAKEGGPIH
ncbi:plectin-like isoform X2 [Mya arenaria]|uniref:plectin-like isoform X2 n=1 Tax=Mya arenaria TaxID=6604 RepID=UPI0022E7CAC9|nr:plectin-like isoform X2 [Mya arenaria]